MQMKKELIIFDLATTLLFTSSHLSNCLTPFITSLNNDQSDHEKPSTHSKAIIFAHNVKNNKQLGMEVKLA